MIFVLNRKKIVKSHQCAASSLSSLAASEAAAAVGAAIDIDTYFRGSNGFFAPMQNSYTHGKTNFITKQNGQFPIITERVFFFKCEMSYQMGLSSKLFTLFHSKIGGWGLGSSIPE